MKVVQQCWRWRSPLVATVLSAVHLAPSDLGPTAALYGLLRFDATTGKFAVSLATAEGITYPMVLVLSECTLFDAGAVSLNWDRMKGKQVCGAMVKNPKYFDSTPSSPRPVDHPCRQ